MDMRLLSPIHLSKKYFLLTNIKSDNLRLSSFPIVEVS